MEERQKTITLHFVNIGISKNRQSIMPCKTQKKEKQILTDRTGTQELWHASKTLGPHGHCNNHYLMIECDECSSNHRRCSSLIILVNV